MEERQGENRGNCVPDTHSQGTRKLESEREQQKMGIIVSQTFIDREKRHE